jgi:hypothetical protein
MPDHAATQSPLLGKPDNDDTINSAKKQRGRPRLSAKPRFILVRSSASVLDAAEARNRFAETIIEIITDQIVEELGEQERSP